MSLSKETIIIVLCVLSVAILKSASAIATLQKSHLFPNDNHELFYDYQSFEKTSFVYALCEKSKIPIKKCGVVLENYSFDKPVESTFCNVNLEFDKQDYNINRVIRVIQLGSDKAILVWWEIARDPSKDVFVKMSILHFPSCKTREIELAMNGLNHTHDNNLPFATIFTTYDDSFDVIFPNKKLCDDNLCKITFDADGYVVNDPVVWSKGLKFEKPPLIFVLPISPLSPLFGNVVVQQQFSENKLELFRYKNNHFQLLQTYDTNDMLSYKYSTANNKIGMCLSTANKTIECLQFDTRGNPTLNETLHLDHPSKKLSMHNTKHGGFLLLTSRSIDCYKDSCLDSLYSYDATRYNASGHATGSLGLGGFHCPINTIAWTTFFERDAEYCASFSCLHPYNVPVSKKKNFLIFKVKCFDDRELERESAGAEAATTALKKSHRFAGHRLFLDRQSVDNTSLIYALCENEEAKSCSIVLEKYGFDDKPTRMSSCDLTLDYDEKLADVTQKVRLISLGGDRAIVVYGKWENNGTDDVPVKFTIVDFSSCKTTENEIVVRDEKSRYVDRLASLFVVYGDTFNVVYPNEALCRDKYCRETYDAEGKRISGPTGWLAVRPDTSVTILPVRDRSPLLGHAVLVNARLDEVENFTLNFSNNEGLIQIQSKVYDEPVNWIYSNAHNTIGICLNQNDTVTCEQFDSDGNKKLNVTLDTESDIEIFSLYNLPNGGFLLLGNGRIRCLEDTTTTCEYDAAEHYVTKFDKNGAKSSSLKLATFGCEDTKITKFFERNENEYCVSFTCAHVYHPSSIYKYEGLLRFEAKCFSEKDL